MKKCELCNEVYEEELEICSKCGNQLVSINQSESTEETMGKDEQCASKFCVYCGGMIVKGKSYCCKCGRSCEDETVRHCVVCGTLLTSNQKFCAKCGNKISKVIVPKRVDDVIEKTKKINLRQILVFCIVAIFSIITILLGKTYIPKLFVSVEDYLAQGQYEKAYEKAKKADKEDVLLENLLAYICAEAKSNLKDEDSFKLREVWYDEEDRELVLKIQGANSYGGDVSSYWYYTFDDEDQEYQLWTSVSDFEEEETYSWDDLEEKLEKLLENAAKESIKEIVNEKNNKLDSEIVKRINNLNKQELLDKVELLEDVSNIYPKDKNEA